MQSGLSRLRTDTDLVEIIRKGAPIWNQWLRDNWETDIRAQRPFLFQADLSCLDLTDIHLFNANLQYANIMNCQLKSADLKTADLSNANVRGATLTDSTLMQASLVEADLTGADLSRSVLAFANFSCASLVEMNISECLVFGVAAWNVKLDGAVQQDLLITRLDEPEITADNLEVAQFFHLMIMNTGIRSAIDTITSKVVLILGSFANECKRVLNAIWDELRHRNYLPVLFDFEKPSSRDLTETISTLAHMARFVIADITDARSLLQELMAIVPTLPSVPVQPLLLALQREYGMFEHRLPLPPHPDPPQVV